MSKILQLKYDELNAIVKTFNGEGEDFAQLAASTRQRLHDLRKDWIGDAADKFFAEMEQDLLPALTRVSKAHFFSQDVLMKVTKIIRETDEENANFFKNIFQGSDDFGASGFESALDGLEIGGGGGLGGDFGASEFESVVEGLDGSGGESGDFGPPPAAGLSAITRDFTQGIELESTKGDEKPPETETPSSGGGGGGGGAGSSQGLQGDLKNMGVGLVDQTPQTSSAGSGAPPNLPDHLFGGGGSGSGSGVPADLSPIPGRGYVRLGSTPLEFQTALTFTPDESDPDGLAKINRMCMRMKDRWDNQWQGDLSREGREKPSTIETLPLRISLENVLQQAALPEVRRINAVMGIDDRSLEPALIDIERQGPHMVVIGQPFSGKTTTLRAMLLSAAYNYSPDEVMMVLVDFSRKLWKGSETSLADLPHVVQAIDDIEQLDGLYESMQVECAEFETNPKRRKIMIFIDNYDAFTEEASRKKMSFFEGMAALVRKYQTEGVYLVIGGSLAILSSSDDLRKVFAAPSFGIALKTADAVGRLNGRFPRSLADVELPQGRAFIVRSGVTSMLQLATPYANDDDVEGSLDAWVRKIQARYPGKKAQWLAPAEETAGEEENAQADGKSKSKAKAKGQPESAAPKPPDVSKYNISTLKQKLVETGLPEDMLALFSDADIVENARAMGLLDEEKE